jgi:hypothetical protein
MLTGALARANARSVARDVWTHRRGRARTNLDHSGGFEETISRVFEC